MVNIPNSITNYVDNQKPLCNSLCVNNSQHFPPDQFQKHMPLNMNYIHHKKDLLFYVLCHCSWFPLKFDDWKQGIIRKLSYWMKHKNHRSLRDHAMYAPSQWEMAFNCNAICVMQSHIGWAHTQNDPCPCSRSPHCTAWPVSLFSFTHPLLKPKYSWKMSSIPWLLMPSLIASPGYQQPRHWICILK